MWSIRVERWSSFGGAGEVVVVVVVVRLEIWLESSGFDLGWLLVFGFFWGGFFLGKDGGGK